MRLYILGPARSVKVWISRIMNAEVKGRDIVVQFQKRDGSIKLFKPALEIAAGGRISLAGGFRASATSTSSWTYPRKNEKGTRNHPERDIDLHQLWDQIKQQVVNFQDWAWYCNNIGNSCAAKAEIEYDFRLSLKQCIIIIPSLHWLYIAAGC